MTTESNATPGPADSGCEVNPKSTEFRKDVAIVGKLVVGQACPVTQTETALVNGDLRVQHTTTLRDLRFFAGTETSAAAVSADTANGKVVGRLGLGGALRVSDALGLGTPPSDDPAATARLVVRGWPSDGDSRPLQVWQHVSQRNVTTVDGRGRLGIGTATPTAGLSIDSVFDTRLTGTLKGYAIKATLYGENTLFQEELHRHDVLSIPTLQSPPNVFEVLDIISNTELVVDQLPGVASFEQQPAYVPDQLLSLRNWAGSELLAVDARGTLRFGGGKASIAANGVVTATRFEGSGAVTPGMILMWSGRIEQIPRGWVLCDGQNSTPDLRSCFMVGAGNSAPYYPPGDHGPPDAHAHTISPPSQTPNSSQVANHTHGWPQSPYRWYDRTYYTYAAVSNGSYSGLDVGGGGGVSNTTTRDNGGHLHSVPINYQPFPSSQSAGTNRPQWYALAFIMAQ
jgi:hypothetical protein